MDFSKFSLSTLSIRHTISTIEISTEPCIKLCHHEFRLYVETHRTNSLNKEKSMFHWLNSDNEVDKQISQCRLNGILKIEEVRDSLTLSILICLIYLIIPGTCMWWGFFKTSNEFYTNIYFYTESCSHIIYWYTWVMYEGSIPSSLGIDGFMAGAKWADCLVAPHSSSF